jgi:hypothetical protein
MVRLPSHQFVRAARFSRESVLCPIFQSQLIATTSLSQSLGAGFSVTYRKRGRVLIAPELWRIDLSPEQLSFYKRAWKAACAKARSLGWIY